MIKNLNVDFVELQVVCKKYHIKSLSVFGSILSEKFNSESDIDLLYEFENGYVLGLDFFHLLNDLENLFKRKIDLVSKSTLHWSISNEIIVTAKEIYAAAA
jgi:predicted nucleotidyltransferase